MALTLDEILGAPTDPEELNKHLLSRGLISPPPAPEAAPPMIPPASITTPMSPIVSHPEVAHLTPPNVTKGVGAPDWTAMEVARAPHPLTPIGKETIGGMPELGEAPAPGAGAAPIGVQPMTPPVAPTRKESNAAGREEFHANRPVVTAAPGTSEFWQQKLSQDEYDKAHPWGSEQSEHPGLLGKIGHVAGLVGQIAGSAINPGLVAEIPGTKLNRETREAGESEELGKTTAAETAQALEKNKEKHEENVESDLQQKLNNAQDKIDNEHQKTLNARELGLRKQGLKPNPTDPTGSPIPLTREDMSEQEQAVTDLKQAQTGAADAKAAVDRIKADPNSPQSKAMLERIRIMAENAGTAAGKLGLDKKKFVADYFGLDDSGNPLAGVQMTPEGKPVGPKIAGSTQKALSEFNKNYEKPANDVEKSYQMANDAYNEYKAAKAEGKDLPTGAQSMVLLSTHLSTTFGNVKGARITKDLIEHHLHARDISDDALVAFQKLTNGDPLSPTQWDAFHELIGRSRKLSWDAATKEAKRANLPVNFLPEDLQGEHATAAPNAAAQPPRAPAAGMEWRRNKKTGEFKEFPVTK